MRAAPQLLAAIRDGVVGRAAEAEVAVAALAAGRNLLLEGPPGTGKSTMLRVAADAAGVGFVFVEGNAELTPARLLGTHDPSQVLDTGWSADTFIDGPLVAALRTGAILYIEEFNRVPEDTLNVLVTALAEREVTVPRVGTITADADFRLVGAMNPFDDIGTARVSEAIADRCCRIALTYQSPDEEAAIVDRVAGSGSPLTSRAVAVTRSTREHAEVRTGSSVRGAIDTVLVATQLAALRDGDPLDPATGLDAALTALSGRIRVEDGCSRTPEDIIRELWQACLDREGREPPAGGEGGAGKRRGPTEVLTAARAR